VHPHLVLIRVLSWIVSLGQETESLKHEWDGIVSGKIQVTFI
jgi:hypothetical protein